MEEETSARAPPSMKFLRLAPSVKFDPNQPRDEQGQWTAGGGSGVGSLFAGAGAGHGASKEGRAWIKSMQEKYDNDPEFRAVADALTTYTQGDYNPWHEFTRHEITGEWSERYKDSSLPEWHAQDKNIITSPLSAYKNYFNGQNVEESKSKIRDAAKGLNNAIASATPLDTPIYRGLVGGRVQSQMESLRVGDTVDIHGVTSFTSSLEVSTEFAEGKAKGQGRMRDNVKHSTIIEVAKGARGIPTGALSPYKQREVVTSGKFKVVSTKLGEVPSLRGGTVSRLHITIEQVGVWKNKSDDKGIVFAQPTLPIPEFYDEAFRGPFLEGELVRALSEEIIAEHSKGIKFDPNQPRDDQGEWTDGAVRGARSKAPALSDRAKRAKAAHVMVDKEIQRYCEEHNEGQVAKALGGVAFPNSEPVDIVVPGPDGIVRHGIELKTMVANTNAKLTVKTDAQARKRTWERKNKATIHTIVLDDSKVFNANGPGKHDLSKRIIYYRRGFGSFRIGSMHPVSSLSEAKGLMNVPTRQLPQRAKP